MSQSAQAPAYDCLIFDAKHQPAIAGEMALPAKLRIAGEHASQRRIVAFDQPRHAQVV